MKGLITILTSTYICVIYGSQNVFEGEELVAAVDEIKNELEEMPVFLQGRVEKCPTDVNRWDPLFETASEASVPKSERAQIGFLDALCYIYTSGTTGLYTRANLGFQLRNLTRTPCLQFERLGFQVFPKQRSSHREDSCWAAFFCCSQVSRRTTSCTRCCRCTIQVA